MGGGLGHLTRARALLHTLNLVEPVVLITASAFAKDPRIVGKLSVVSPEQGLASQPETYRAWLQSLLHRLRPAQLYIDAFPAGVVGEWCDFSFPTGMAIYHVARLLQWERYERRLKGTSPHFKTTYLLEPLTGRHAEFTHSHSDSTVSTTLSYPPTPLASEIHQAFQKLKHGGRDVWLIIHSGSEQELLELLDYAREIMAIEKQDPRLVLVSPERPTALPREISYLNAYPASALYDQANRIISACGFNLMQQTLPYRDRHSYLPFPRALDDQFLRAARSRGYKGCNQSPAHHYYRSG